MCYGSTPPGPPHSQLSQPTAPPQLLTAAANSSLSASGTWMPSSTPEAWLPAEGASGGWRGDDKRASKPSWGADALEQPACLMAGDSPTPGPVDPKNRQALELCKASPLPRIQALTCAAVVEERDVPTRAQQRQELAQRAGPLGEVHLRGMEVRGELGCVVGQKGSEWSLLPLLPPPLWTCSSSRPCNLATVSIRMHCIGC